MYDFSDIHPHACRTAETLSDWWNCLDFQVFGIFMGGVTAIMLCLAFLAIYLHMLWFNIKP